MKPSTESNDWLGLFLWGLDILMSPTSQKILESFESWNYRNRLRFDLLQLRRSGMVERRSANARSQWRLAEPGRLAAFGGVDPASRWSRKWDGRWRLLLFDLPARQQRLRLILWRWLRRQRFGYLQQSVWIVPDTIKETSTPLRQFKLTPESLTVIEGTPAPPDTNDDIVRSAWDFALINRNYTAAIKLAIAGRRFVQAGKPVEMRKWLADERSAWLEAIANDPLLPEALLPKDYLGQKAFRERQITFSILSKALAKHDNK
jgi:phenylacetic acid degradation operon negative regulatory protein